MAAQPDAQSRSQSGQLKNKANQFFVWYTGAILQIYKNVLSEPIARIVPEHTREAFFQAYCDLRTNVPKDRRWVEQHAAALQPRTLLGWLALGSFLAFSGAAGSATLCLASATIAALAYAFIGIIVVAGATAGFWLFVLSGVMFVSSIVIAWLATCAAAGYIFLASTAASLSYLHSRIAPNNTASSSPAEAESNAPKAVTDTTDLPQLSVGPKTIASSVPQLSRGSTATTAAQDVSPGRLQSPGEAFPAAETITLADVVQNIARGGLGPNPDGKTAAAVHPSKIKAHSPPVLQT